MSGGVNRAARLYENWESRQSQLEAMGGGMKPEDKGLLKLKYDFLREGLYRISASPSEQEKLHVFALGVVVGMLERLLYPNRLARVFQQLKSAVWDKPRHLRVFQEQRAENLASLTAMMKKMGMGGLSGKLENTLDYESPSLVISGMHMLADQGKLVVALQLEKEGLGAYRPLDYQLVWNTADEQLKSCRIPVESGIELSEAFNMLQGRAVYKGFENVEGKLVRQWVQLDPTVSATEKPIVAFLPDPGFELKKSLQDTAVTLEVYGLMKEQVLKQLESGNRVELQVAGKGAFSVEANPGAKSLKLFDRLGQPVSVEVLQRQLQHSGPEMGKEFKLIRQEHVDQALDRYIYR